ncbi:LuxR C-terminal-related transcriptional regulator [Methylobacterium sp.]|uniref:helix-turn-helix transcriptional regulator n=1 Tax=Methylobacterium sp. TaxID=409 RepID=UPI0034522AC7
MLDPSLRAALEHEPALCTLSEGDIDELRGEPAVALVVLSEAGLKATALKIATLKHKQADLKVVVAFQSLPGEALRLLLASGTDAVVARQSSPREVCSVLLGLMQSSAAAIAKPEPSRDLDLGDGLTPREAEILRFLSAGFSNKEVARRLSLSVRTVETHRLNLRRKTQTGRLKDLVALARKLGLAPVVDVDSPRRSSSEAHPAMPKPSLEASPY